MNRQIKSVTIAAAIGLALSLLIQVPSLLTTGYISPLDRFNPFNPSILGYWVGALGGIPLLLIIGVVIVTWRKAGLLYSLLNGVGAIVTVTLIICISIVALATIDHPNKDAPLAGASADRATFVKSATASCIRGQQSAPQNKTVAATTIDAFCSCYGNSLADVATLDELQYMAQQHTAAPSLAVKISAAYQKCVRVVTGNK